MLQPTALTRSRHPNNDFTPVVGQSSLFDLLSIERSFDENEIIFDEGEEIDFIYKVTQGVVSTHKSFSDGRRKIQAFHLCGDVFGVDFPGKRQCCAQAIGPVNVRIGRNDNITAADEVIALMGHELLRIQRHALLLAMSSTQRVAHFLLEMCSRLEQGEVLTLPMTRQDIADHLGWT